MKKVIYDSDGKITGLTGDPREESDVLTDMDAPEIWDYEVQDGELVYAPAVVVFNLAEEKNKLIETVTKKAEWAFSTLDVKYRFTHERGVAKTLVEEFYKYQEDNSTTSPVIEQYTLQKGRTDKAEQVAKIGRVINFEISAVIMIEDLIGSIQDATNEEEIDALRPTISAIEELATIDAFMSLVVA